MRTRLNINIDLISEMPTRRSKTKKKEEKGNKIKNNLSNIHKFVYRNFGIYYA